MTTTQTASERIIEEVTSWPGVEIGTNARGGDAFMIGRREIGHLHGDRSLHTGFPKEVWTELKAQGRIVDHPVFPGKPGPAARALDTPDDVRDAIELLRLNYDRVIERYGMPDDGRLSIRLTDAGPPPGHIQAPRRRRPARPASPPAPAPGRGPRRWSSPGGR